MLSTSEWILHRPNKRFLPRPTGRKSAHPSRYAEGGSARIKTNKSLLLSLYFLLRFHLFIFCASEFDVLRVSRHLGTFSPHQSRYDASISDALCLDALSNYIASVIDVLSSILDFYHLFGSIIDKKYY